ncbi:MAG TPA: NAD(P) transhydrogenase subunit alpha [Candidatus Hydrogenedentes bacterium]|nr:NAD(P) transhydrogenase subunit alpha [Candidatus Hydrogenedentota bacterium]HOV76205.1 NAD(P) transhydrogenase subunit alpha [Candidatus Hydrogenedentota bacterium]HPC14799.1 NAD(P) transhydrogenase subunit alpha [Candidatus Hydrogenedentota bacterium]HRT18663.1 NAD(P) transhydrogenase subunit alpha [Candidatus Hydrogenedentota bacterium]HRT63683.1 NAD(P) transhydrogenase subunit alpha [Candidatus Hydrogenedentota bacterium]
MSFKGLTLGIPVEIMEHEYRVSAIPETVAKFIEQGARVLVESRAGEAAHHYDDTYREAGAEIVPDSDSVFERADVILKVKEPQFDVSRNRHETALMRRGQILVAFLHPASPANHRMVRDLAERGVVSFTLDGVPRISHAQAMDALTSMSTVAGYKGVVMAADQLGCLMPLTNTAVGMLPPAQVFVVGAGVAGLQALATAKRLGAVNFAADIRPEAVEQAKSLRAQIVETGVPPDISIGAGGYAKALPHEWLLREQEAIRQTVIRSDIVILSALVPGRIAPVLVTEEMVRGMKNGSVIVDIAIDQGGNCALTESGRTVVKHGVTIIGAKNIPGYVPQSASWLFSHNLYHFLSYLIRDGVVRTDRNDEIIGPTLVTLDGEVVHAGALEAMAQCAG